MGRSSGNYFLFRLTPEAAATCLFCVASKLYPAKIETKTINGKSLKFQIPGCLFLTRSRMLLWTHLFRPEVNSYSLRVYDLPSWNGVENYYWLFSSLLGVFLPSSTNSQKLFPSLLNAYGLEFAMSVTHFKILFFSPRFFTCFSLVLYAEK